MGLDKIDLKIPTTVTEKQIDNEQITAWDVRLDIAIKKVMIRTWDHPRQKNIDRNVLFPDVFKIQKLATSLISTDQNSANIKNWCTLFVKLLLEKQFPGSEIRISNKPQQIGDLTMKDANSKKFVFIAWRQQYTLNYQMPMKHWLDIASKEKQNKLLLVLIDNAGTSTPEVTLINEPAEALSKNQFVFEPTGFRLLDAT
jgi:hypothetical protein